MTKPIKGWKCFDKDLKCRNHQFEVGGTYEVEGEIPGSQLTHIWSVAACGFGGSGTFHATRCKVTCERCLEISKPWQDEMDRLAARRVHESEGPESP